MELAPDYCTVQVTQGTQLGHHQSIYTHAHCYTNVLDDYWKYTIFEL